MSAAFLRSLRWMMAIAAPAGLFLVALGLQLTVLVFGDVWRPAGYAAMAMAGFAVGGAVTSLVSELLRSQERPAATYSDACHDRCRDDRLHGPFGGDQPHGRGGGP